MSLPALALAQDQRASFTGLLSPRVACLSARLSAFALPLQVMTVLVEDSMKNNASKRVRERSLKLPVYLLLQHRHPEEVRRSNANSRGLPCQ